MSAPVVSGAVALLLSKYPDMKNVEVKLRLLMSADDIGILSHIIRYGKGSQYSGEGTSEYREAAKSNIIVKESGDPLTIQKD